MSNTAEERWLSEPDFIVSPDNGNLQAHFPILVGRLDEKIKVCP